MSWVRSRKAGTHECARPSASHREGDLWRCWACGALWRVGRACDLCDRGTDRPHGGQHAVGVAWRRAKLWQRLRYRRDGWEPDLPFEADVSGKPPVSQIGRIEVTDQNLSRECDHLWKLDTVATTDGSPWHIECLGCGREFRTVEDYRELFG